MKTKITILTPKKSRSKKYNQEALQKQNHPSQLGKNTFSQ